jgi:hypothetical protein
VGLRRRGPDRPIDRIDRRRIPVAKELIWHSAEIWLLRDLYAASGAGGGTL